MRINCDVSNPGTFGLSMAKIRASLSRSTGISSYCCIKFQAMVNTDLDNDSSYMQKCPKRS